MEIKLQIPKLQNYIIVKVQTILLQLHGYVLLSFPKESKNRQMHNFDSGKALIVRYQIYYGKGKRNTVIYLT